jgi:hypothetical protein
MSTPAILPPTALPATLPKMHPEAVHDENATTSPSRAAKKDEAVVSKEGKGALATHEADQTAPTKGLSAGDAAVLGQGLKRSNPAHFKQYDTNGDGKLSAQEAHAAGLG